MSIFYLRLVISTDFLSFFEPPLNPFLAYILPAISVETDPVHLVNIRLIFCVFSHYQAWKIKKTGIPLKFVNLSYSIIFGKICAEKNSSQNLIFFYKPPTVRLVITFNGIIIKLSCYYTKSQYFYSINYYCTYFHYNYRLIVTMGLFLHLIIIDIYNIFVEKHTNWIINHRIINEYHYIVHNYNIK